VAYHGATYPKVLRWVTFFEGREDLEKRWGLAFEEFVRSLELPHAGRITREGILDGEKAMHQEKIALIRSLIRYEGKGTQGVLRSYLRRYEIKNLVNVVLSLLYHRPTSVLYEIGQGYVVQPPFTDGIKDLKELQSLLIRTPYYRLAQDAFPEMERTGETFGFEMRLYEFFLEELVEAMRRSGEWGAWKETLLFGLQMERVIYVARMKFGYSRTTEEVLAYFPPVGEARGWWLRLLNARSLEEFVRWLPSSLRLGEVQDLATLAKVLPERVISIVWPRVRQPGSARFLGAFLLLLEVMVQNWQVALEAKRYQLSWDRVGEFLVRGGRHAVF